MIEFLVLWSVVFAIYCAWVGWQVLELKRKADFDWNVNQLRMRRIEDEIWGLYELDCDSETNQLPGPIRSSTDSTMAPAAGVWGDGAGGEG